MHFGMLSIFNCIPYLINVNFILIRMLYCRFLHPSVVFCPVVKTHWANTNWHLQSFNARAVSTSLQMSRRLNSHVGRGSLQLTAGRNESSLCRRNGVMSLFSHDCAGCYYRKICALHLSELVLSAVFISRDTIQYAVSLREERFFLHVFVLGCPPLPPRSSTLRFVFTFTWARKLVARAAHWN